MLFAPGTLPRGPKVDTSKALLLIDFQNDFVTSTGGLPVPNTDRFIKNIPLLASKFRESGQIVWIQSIFRQARPCVSPQTGNYEIILRPMVQLVSQQSHDQSPAQSTSTGGRRGFSRSTIPPGVDEDDEAFLSCQPSGQGRRCCSSGSVGAELPAPLVAAIDRQKDFVFTKSYYSAFGDMSLLMQLRARRINHLYICGSLSNVGVYATISDAVQQGFNVTIVEDCLGYRDDACHMEAMQRMADDFGVEGIDYQELMDDLCGLLGDVIPASQFTRRLELPIASQGARPPQQSRSQTVSQWINSIEDDSETEKARCKEEVSRKRHSLIAFGASGDALADPRMNESNTPRQKPQASPTSSPPRKRSSSDREEIVDTSPTRSRNSLVSAEDDAQPESISSAKKSKVTPSRTHRPVREKSTRTSRQSPPFLGQTMSTGRIETRKAGVSEQIDDRSKSQPNLTVHPGIPDNRPATKKKTKPAKHDPNYLGQDDVVGEGDSRVIYDLLNASEADQYFHKLKTKVAWQKMYHRTGEVPRLVAVQGVVSDDGSIPIYRHPADESPPLLPFDVNVDILRQQCEEAVGHPLNHVLIQYYRTCEDNISEHSDKSLDIIRGSNIINLSIGAMRTMTLRSKKISAAEVKSSDPTKQAGDGAPRSAQRIRLPHNSLFILGERTNSNWLHSIRADKRPPVEKSAEELAFEGERISLTFRNIGTFINPDKNIIWGQGATAKTRDQARPIESGVDAGKSGEEMIIGFGKENHLNAASFDWNEVYGKGFDVVNFEIKENKE